MPIGSVVHKSFKKSFLNLINRPTSVGSQNSASQL